MATNQKLSDRVAETQRAVLALMSIEELERIVGDDPAFRALPDSDLELIAAGGPLPSRLRRLLAGEN